MIPNKNQCKGCHTNGKEFLPIGISARHLNKTVRFSGIQGNQLKEWANKGWLKGLPADGIPANADWENTTASLMPGPVPIWISTAGIVTTQPDLPIHLDFS